MATNADEDRLVATLQRQLQRERTARLASERLLEHKSRELFDGLDRLREALASAQASERRMQLALWSNNAEIWEWQGSTDLFESRAFMVRDGEAVISREPLVDRRSRIHEHDRMAVVRAWHDHMFGVTEHYEVEYRNWTGDEWRWLAERGRAVQRDARGMALAIVGTATDVTTVKTQQRDLSLLARAFDDTSDGMCVLDPDGRIVDANRAFSGLVGRSRESLLGVEWLAQIDEVNFSAWADAVTSSFSRGAWQGELRFDCTGGHRAVDAWVSFSCLKDRGGRVTHHVLVITDIGERKEAEARLRKLANFDTLTGLANRWYVQERLGIALTKARRMRHELALLFIDLDRFKQVNDSLGHAGGDMLLTTVANRLQEAVRESDLAGRWGGDEFVVLLEPIRSSQDAARVAEKLMQAVSAPLTIDGVEVTVSCSIGVCMFPEDGGTAGELLEHSDAAMYAAKAAGRNAVRFYRHDMNDQARNRLELEQALRMAMTRGELWLAFQPRVRIGGGAVASVEALLRWNSPRFGVVPPGVFIPIAEESGLIVDIGNWVLEHALQQLRAWADTGLGHLTVSINISPRQLTRDDFVRTLGEALARHGVPGSALEIEVTEGCFLDNAEWVIEVLSGARALGVGVAVDDFGTGYSSLAYLKELPITTLKIDRSFITDIGVDRRGEAIVDTIMALGRNLGIQVVAEGVESERQLEYLRVRGCDEVQGFLFYKPLAAAVLEETLEAERRLPKHLERIARISVVPH